MSFQKGRNTVVIQTGQAGVKHPSLSFLIKIDNTNGLRVSAHPGFDRAVPVIATVSHRVSGQTTWLQSQATCAANKMTLCKRVDICPSGKLKEPIGGKRDQEAWVATSGGMNEWTSIGDFEASKNLCRTHEDSMGTRPLWSAMPTEHNFRTEVICCGVKNAVLDAIASDITIESFAMPKSTTWKQANEICTSAGQLLCSKDEICPDGPNTQPISGKVQNQGEAPTQEKSQRDSDVWVPTRGVANEWTSVGNYDPSNRLCRTHTDSLGANPTWSASTGNHNFRQEVLCCSPGTPLVRTNTDVPKAKPDVVQVWDACASLDEERAECAAFFLEVSTSPIPANEGYCESKVLEEVSELTNQETCGDKENGIQSNSNIGFNYDIKFTLTEPVELSFRFGVDFGYGGVVSIDNEVIKTKFGEEVDLMSVEDVTLQAGEHHMHVAGAEKCCDGAQTFSYKVGQYGLWQTLNSANLGANDVLGFDDGTGGQMRAASEKIVDTTELNQFATWRIDINEEGRVTNYLNGVEFRRYYDTRTTKLTRGRVSIGFSDAVWSVNHVKVTEYASVSNLLGTSSNTKELESHRNPKQSGSYECYDIASNTLKHGIGFLRTYNIDVARSVTAVLKEISYVSKGANGGNKAFGGQGPVIKMPISGNQSVFDISIGLMRFDVNNAVDLKDDKVSSATLQLTKSTNNNAGAIQIKAVDCRWLWSHVTYNGRPTKQANDQFCWRCFGCHSRFLFVAKSDRFKYFCSIECQCTSRIFDC